MTLTAGAGVTVNSLSTSLILGQYQVATLIKQATNTWIANLGGSGGASDSDQNILANQIFG